MSSVDRAALLSEIASTFPKHTIEFSAQKLTSFWDVRLIESALQTIVFVAVGRRGKSGTELADHELKHVEDTLKIYQPCRVHGLQVYWDEKGTQRYQWYFDIAPAGPFGR